MVLNLRITGSSRRPASSRRGTPAAAASGSWYALAGAGVGAVVGLLLGHRLPLTMYSKFGGPNHMYGLWAGVLWGVLLGVTATAARSGSAVKCTAAALLITVCVTTTVLAPR